MAANRWCFFRQAPEGATSFSQWRQPLVTCRYRSSPGGGGIPKQSSGWRHWLNYAAAPRLWNGPNVNDEIVMRRLGRPEWRLISTKPQRFRWMIANQACGPPALNE